MQNQLETDAIKKIVSEVAKANLTSKFVREVRSEPATDSVGREALRITIVIVPGAEAKIKGDALVDTLAQIQDRLRQAGEERFPIVEYATTKELKQSGAH